MSECVELEVVDGIQLPPFHPPLTDPFDPILIRMNRPISETFSLFSSPHLMSSVSGASSMG